MNSCPYCSHNLLRHLRSHNLYWYCQHCRSETSDSFISVQNRPILRKSEPLKAHHFGLISSL